MQDEKTMTVSRQTTIWCDGCEVWEQYSGNATEVRATLKLHGWVYANRLDKCPKCKTSSETTRANWLKSVE